MFKETHTIFVILDKTTNLEYVFDKYGNKWE